MKILIVALLSIATAAECAPAQCCIGAQHVAALSANGRYRVQAISLVGTGFQHHGPYAHRFRMEELREGHWRELGAFDARWETDEHFALELHVSSTGNGVLIDMNGSPTLDFRTARGELVAAHPREVFELSPETPKDPRYLQLIDGESVPIPGHPNALSHVPCGQLFLPFGAPVGPDLEQRLVALLAPEALRVAERAEAERCLHQLATGDENARRAAREVLLALGPRALSRLRELTLAESEPTARARLQDLRREIQVRAAAGHEDPERDLVLLGALLTYPSARVAKLASARLDALLPPPFLRDEVSSYAFADLADWLALHAHELRWNEADQRYSR
jgi:hypothetical protein